MHFGYATCQKEDYLWYKPPGSVAAVMSFFPNLLLVELKNVGLSTNRS